MSPIFNVLSTCYLLATYRLPLTPFCFFQRGKKGLMVIRCKYETTRRRAHTHAHIHDHVYPRKSINCLLIPHLRLIDFFFFFCNSILISRIYLWLFINNILMAPFHSCSSSFCFSFCFLLFFLVFFLTFFLSYLLFFSFIVLFSLDSLLD